MDSFFNGNKDNEMLLNSGNMKDNFIVSNLNEFIDLFSVRDLLGVGGFGVVLLVKNKNTGEKSALKIINKSRLSANA